MKPTNFVTFKKSAAGDIAEMLGFRLWPRPWRGARPQHIPGCCSPLCNTWRQDVHNRIELELPRRTVISFQCPRQPLLGKHIHEVRHIKAGDDE